MAKTINITDIKIKEFSISESEGKYTIAIIYSLLDANSKEYDSKRIEMKDEDFTSTEKTKVGQILTAISNKIKIKEEI